MGETVTAGRQRPSYSHIDIELPLSWLGGRLRLREGLRPELWVGCEEGTDRSMLSSFRLAWGSEVTVRSLRLGVRSRGADDEVLPLATRRKTKWKGVACERLWSSALIF